MIQDKHEEVLNGVMASWRVKAEFEEVELGRFESIEKAMQLAGSHKIELDALLTHATATFNVGAAMIDGRYPISRHLGGTLRARAVKSQANNHMVDELNTDHLDKEHKSKYTGECGMG